MYDVSAATKEKVDPNSPGAADDKKKKKTGGAADKKKQVKKLK